MRSKEDMRVASIVQQELDRQAAVAKRRQSEEDTHLARELQLALQEEVGARSTHPNTTKCSSHRVLFSASTSYSPGYTAVVSSLSASSARMALERRSDTSWAAICLSWAALLHA